MSRRGWIGVVLCWLLSSSSAWAVPDTILSISPDATDGTTITASDENSRSTSIETAHNNHSHTDITQTGTALNIGASSGRTSIGDSTIVMEGSTNDANELTISFTDPTADHTVTVANDSGVWLPDGALIFMIEGSCPPGTTDITATHSDRFIRVNATPDSTGGASTDSITLTTTELPAHTHSGGSHGHAFRTTDGASGDATGGLMLDVNGTRTNRSAFTGTLSDTAGEQIGASGSNTTGSTGSGTAFTVDTVPTFVTAILCQVD